MSIADLWFFCIFQSIMDKYGQSNILGKHEKLNNLFTQIQSDERMVEYLSKRDAQSLRDVKQRTMAKLTTLHRLGKANSIKPTDKSTEDPAEKTNSSRKNASLTKLVALRRLGALK